MPVPRLTGPVWMAPPYVTPLKRWLEKLVFTRFLTWFSPCIWGSADGYSTIRYFLHGTAFGRRIVDKFWNILGDDVVTLNGYDKHPETKKLKPWSNPMFVATSLSILNYDHDFFDLVRTGKITIHIADFKSFSKHTVHLSSGERLNADAFVCCTGWKHKPPLQFLPPGSDASYGLPHFSEKINPLVQRADQEILTTLPRLMNQPAQNPKLTAQSHAPADILAPMGLSQPYRLYRFMTPPSLISDRSLGFAGIAPGLSTSISATIQALWLCAFFDGRIPIDGDVEYETVLHSRFGKWRASEGHGSKYPDFAFDTLPFFDMLLQQLGLQSHRKGGRIAEWFNSYGPEDYRGLVDEWKAKYGMA